jgi:hypothetical protein
MILWRFEMNDLKELDGINDTSKRERRKTIWFYASLISLAIFVVVIFPSILPINPEVSGSSSPKINQMKRLVAKIGKHETEVLKTQKELFDLLKEYSQKTGETLPALNVLGLSEEEKKIFEDKLINVKDVSIKSLLEDILAKDNEIAGLKAEMGKYEAMLPKPHITAEGENHYQIAMEYLINEKKVKKERALRLIERAALFDPLPPGFRVWNFYSSGEFATFVTQGSADISPNELRKMAIQYLKDARDRAIAEKEKIAAEINALESVRGLLVSEISVLRDEKQEIIRKLADLSKQNLEMQRALNSLFFMVDLEDNLIKRGIIKDALLGILGSPKLKEISPEYFNQKIDLRKTNVIEIYASQFNLSKIKKISIYPRFYKKGVDYEVKIEKDKQKAILVILAILKFRSERVIISVE